MKKVIICILTLALSAFLCGNIMTKRDTKNIDAKIYYVDHSMLRLIPIDVNFSKTTKKKAAEKMIEKIIDGRDENSKILRVIPNKKGCMSVEVKKNTAVVDIKESFLKEQPENKVHGLLAIYSVVNSLCSIEGIDTVKFFVDGKSEKGFVSGLDMRETFIPDYYF